MLHNVTEKQWFNRKANKPELLDCKQRCVDSGDKEEGICRKYWTMALQI